MSRRDYLVALATERADYATMSNADLELELNALYALQAHYAECKEESLRRSCAGAMKLKHFRLCAGKVSLAWAADELTVKREAINLGINVIKQTVIKPDELKRENIAGFHALSKVTPVKSTVGKEYLRHE